ncbi:MAG: GNAT family N-acetyltransferase [Boseongicola sp.]|nr:GNAT family N-acetyltransferase [Boseongicola sp.]
MTVVFRRAAKDDIPAIVSLLKDDELGKGREASDLAVYEAAFEAISAEPGNAVIVGVVNGKVVATYQLTLISNLSLTATRRAQIEGVRVAAQCRGQGIGAALLADAEARARQGGAGLMQFTSNKARNRAHDFYERAGFAASHIGFKKRL